MHACARAHTHTSPWGLLRQLCHPKNWRIQHYLLNLEELRYETLHLIKWWSVLFCNCIEALSLIKKTVQCHVTSNSQYSLNYNIFLSNCWNFIHPDLIKLSRHYVMTKKMYLNCKQILGKLYQKTQKKN